MLKVAIGSVEVTLKIMLLEKFISLNYSTYKI